MGRLQGFSRKMRIAQLICAIALGAPQISIAQTKAEKDSIFQHASAVNLLRLFEYRYNTLVRIPGARNLRPMFPIYGSCEFRIGDYCYGPKNGGLTPGGPGTDAESRSMTPSNFSKVFQKRSNAYINLYVSDHKRIRKIIPGERWHNGEIARVEI